VEDSASVFHPSVNLLGLLVSRKRPLDWNLVCSRALPLYEMLATCTSSSLRMPESWMFFTKLRVKDSTNDL